MPSAEWGEHLWVSPRRAQRDRRAWPRLPRRGRRRQQAPPKRRGGLGRFSRRIRPLSNESAPTLAVWEPARQHPRQPLPRPIAPRCRAMPSAPTPAHPSVPRADPRVPSPVPERPRPGGGTPSASCPPPSGQRSRYFSLHRARPVSAPLARAWRRSTDEPTHALHRNGGGGRCPQPRRRGTHSVRSHARASRYRLPTPLVSADRTRSRRRPSIVRYPRWHGIASHPPPIAPPPTPWPPRRRPPHIRQRDCAAVRAR